jgi:hypothetical protein
MGEKRTRPRRNPLLGAAVLRALLEQRGPENRHQAQALYDGVLRDLELTDAEVQAYLEEHVAEVEDAIRSHGRRG